MLAVITKTDLQKYGEKYQGQVPPYSYTIVARDGETYVIEIDNDKALDLQADTKAEIVEYEGDLEHFPFKL